MATSGTTTYSVTAAQIIAAAQEAIGVYVTTPTTYETPANIAALALATLAVTNPTSAHTTAATTAVAYRAAQWTTYGLTTSSGNYPYHWVEPLQFGTAVSLAGRFGLTSQIAVLKQLADDALLRARWSTQRTDGLSTLNMLAKAWQEYGLRTWCSGTSTATNLTASTASYTVGPGLTIALGRALDITNLYLRDSSGMDRPLTRYSKTDYLALSDKDQEGTPSAYYYEETRTGGTLYLWPVPSESYVASTSGWQILFDYTRPPEDYTATANDVEFPAEWFEALKLALAVRFGAQYERPVPPELATLADRALMLVKDTAHENGTITFATRYGP